jgi:hypothetical protein
LTLQLGGAELLQARAAHTFCCSSILLFFALGRSMADWRTELEALVSETMAFVEANQSQKPAASIVALSPAKPPSEITSEAPPARNDVPTALGNLSADRDDIDRRVGNFRAYQQRLIREREDYAASVLNKIAPSNR